MVMSYCNLFLATLEERPDLFCLAINVQYLRIFGLRLRPAGGPPKILSAENHRIKLYCPEATC